MVRKFLSGMVARSVHVPGARCHQFKKDCPGAAVARECTADRVLLSTFMEEHWKTIGYLPDTGTGTFNDEDQDQDIEVQVGSKQIETNVIPDNTHSSKYNSVIVKGFKKDTPSESILDILSQNGLPDEFSMESFIQNENTGSITLENLKSEDCLALVVNMNRKRFLKRQIFVTAVVFNSPVKSQSRSDSATNGAPASSPGPGSVPPALPLLQPLLPKPPPSPSSLQTVPPVVSPGVQQKIDQIEKQASSTSELIVESNVRAEKRKSESSPETSELSRKEKKVLREGEKKQDKMRKKLEYKEKNSLQVEVTLTK